MVRFVVGTVVVLGLGVIDAAAQPLGTFRWQLTPYCNVLTLAVTQVGTQYRFEGFDDQCGATPRAAVTGLAIANADGTLEFGWVIVSAGGPQHVDATFSIPTLGGPWRDSGGNTGTLVFNPAAPSGPPRPAGLGAIAINPAQIQSRITGACGPGQFVQGVNADGSVQCAADASGAGTITAVSAGSGLTGGGTAGAVTLAVDPAVVQRRVTGVCGAGQYLQSVAADGAVSCGADATVALAGSGSAATAARSDHTHALGGNGTAVGTGALAANTTGQRNTAVGASALDSNTTASDNVAVGVQALQGTTTGHSNVAVGNNALLNSTGTQNVAVGHRALESNQTGGANVAVGLFALNSNTIGSLNTAVGPTVMAFNTTGGQNTALGVNALNLNTTGGSNTAVGAHALVFSPAGSEQTAVGAESLQQLTSGNRNTVLGANVLRDLTTGSSNIGIGYSAGINVTSGSDNILIGSQGLLGDTATIRIGTTGTHAATFVAGIHSGTATDQQVLVDADGRLGTVVSSKRFKERIAPLDESPRLLRLRPVSFVYKPEVDSGARERQFGLIAEEVAETMPELVVRDADGQPLTVRYHLLAPLLLAEVQRLERERARMADELAALRALIDRR